MKNLYLIEFYTNENGITGFDINFAWVYATDKANAVQKLKDKQGKRFDVVITNEQQAEIVKLHGKFRVNTPDANLFIIQ